MTCAQFAGAVIAVTGKSSEQLAREFTPTYRTLAATVSFGYPTGTWGVAARQPVDQVSYRNTWGSDVGFSVPEPLWNP